MSNYLTPIKEAPTTDKEATTITNCDQRDVFELKELGNVRPKQLRGPISDYHNKLQRIDTRNWKLIPLFRTGGSVNVNSQTVFRNTLDSRGHRLSAT